MKRRRISNEAMEKAVQKRLPHYKLIDAYRPDGDYINNSRYTFELSSFRFDFPKRFTLVDNTEEESNLSIGIEYEEGEKHHIWEMAFKHIIWNIKDAMSAYCGYLDINQTIEIVQRYIREVFTASYIEKNKIELEYRIQDIANHIFENEKEENGLLKAARLYGKLNEEVKWIAVRNVNQHFSYTFPPANKIFQQRQQKESRIDIGCIYTVKLPLRDSNEFGGGVARPCLVIGKSSENFYYIVPLYHKKNVDKADKEYFVCSDEKGKPIYALRGFVEPVAESNIFEFEGKLNKKDFERLAKLIARDNKIKSGCYDFSIGFGSESADDVVKTSSNNYDKNFDFPDNTKLYRIIAKQLAFEERISAGEIYVKVDNKYEHIVNRDNGDVVFKFSRQDGRVRIIKFTATQPVEVLSNYKALTTDGIPLDKLTPDKYLSGSYRSYMSMKYPMFKYFVMKRFASFYHGQYVKKEQNSDIITLPILPNVR